MRLRCVRSAREVLSQDQHWLSELYGGTCPYPLSVIIDHLTYDVVDLPLIFLTALPTLGIMFFGDLGHLATLAHPTHLIGFPLLFIPSSPYRSSIFSRSDAYNLHLDRLPQRPRSTVLTVTLMLLQPTLTSSPNGSRVNHKGTWALIPSRLTYGRLDSR